MTYHKAHINEGYDFYRVPAVAVKRQVGRAINGVTLAVPAAFAVVSTCLGFAQQGHNALRDTVSELALGQYGFLQTAVFFGFAVALWMLGYKLTAAEGKKALATATLLAFAGVGFLLIAIFPTQRSNGTYLVDVLIHRDAAQGVAGLFPAIAGSMALFFRRTDGWRTVATISAVLAIACLALDAMCYQALLTGGPLLGLLERGILACGLAWTEMVSVKLVIGCKKC